MLTSIILLSLGIVCATYGYFSLGGGKSEVLTNEYQDINIADITTLFALSAGIICAMIGVLGILSVKFKYSKYYWLFSCPYIILALACGIFMIVISVLASGAGNYVERVSIQACNTELESGLTIGETIRQDYNKLVDRNMC